MGKDRATEFLDKAEKLLRWTEKNLEMLRKFGTHAEMDDVEREFVAALLNIDSMHQALADAAKKLEKTEWRNALNESRESDVLLNYLWNARNSETHDALVKWRPSLKTAQLRVIEPDRANQVALFQSLFPYSSSTAALICYVYCARSELALIEILKQGGKPSPERMRTAGVELWFSIDSLVLDSFEIGRGKGARKIPAPCTHLGKPTSASADIALHNAIDFYGKKLKELKATCQTTELI